MGIYAELAAKINKRVGNPRVGNPHFYNAAQTISKFGLTLPVNGVGNPRVGNL